MKQTLLDRLTKEASRVMTTAFDEAKEGREFNVDTQHILLGLAKHAESVSSKALAEVGFTYDIIKKEVSKNYGNEYIIRSTEDPSYHEDVQKLLELAFVEATQMGQTYIGTEHLLLGMIALNQGSGMFVLRHISEDYGDGMLLVRQLRPTVMAMTSEGRWALGKTGLVVTLQRLSRKKLIPVGVLFSRMAGSSGVVAELPHGARLTRVTVSYVDADGKNRRDTMSFGEN